MITLGPAVEIAIRLGVGLLFASAAVHKLRSPTEFADTVTAYLRGGPFGTAAMKWTTAGLVVAAEIVAVALCLLPVPAAGAGAAAAAILLMYAIAMGANIARGNVLLDCGCGWAADRQPVSYTLVVRNLVLAAVAALLLLPVSGDAAAPFDIVNGVLLAGLLLVTFATSNQLILNAQQLKAKRI